MKILEVYYTTSQFGQVARDLGHEVISIKMSNREVTETTELVDNDYDMVWYMPECRFFSIAAISHYWTADNQPKNFESAEALRAINKMLDFVLALPSKPVIFMENPVGKLRKLIDRKDLKLVTLTQCQYGDDRMKPTDVWTNTDWTPRPRCKNGDDCHESAPRGSSKGTQGRKTKIDKARLPIDLIKEILSAASK